MKLCSWCSWGLLPEKLNFWPDFQSVKSGLMWIVSVERACWGEYVYVSKSVERAMYSSPDSGNVARRRRASFSISGLDWGWLWDWEVQEYSGSSLLVIWRFWGPEVAGTAVSGESNSAAGQNAVQYLGFWIWWSWGTVLSKFANQTLNF